MWPMAGWAEESNTVREQVDEADWRPGADLCLAGFDLIVPPGRAGHSCWSTAMSKGYRKHGGRVVGGAVCVVSVVSNAKQASGPAWQTIRKGTEVGVYRRGLWVVGGRGVRKGDGGRVMGGGEEEVEGWIRSSSRRKIALACAKLNYPGVVYAPEDDHKARTKQA